MAGEPHLVLSKHGETAWTEYVAALNLDDPGVRLIAMHAFMAGRLSALDDALAIMRPAVVAIVATPSAEDLDACPLTIGGTR